MTDSTMGRGQMETATGALPAYDRDSQELGDVYADQGVVLVADVLDDQEVGELAQNIERYRRWMLPAVPHDWARYEADGTVRTIHYLDRVDPWFERFGKREDFRLLVERATRCAAEFSSLETFNKPPHVGSASLVHQDGVYFDGTSVSIFHMWIAVDAATGENGALLYWPGTHRRGLLPVEEVAGDPYLKTIAPAVVDELGPPRVAELGPGSAALHSGLVVHASPPNTSSRPRRAISLAYKLTP
jgi:phytanoyl-CoA hydroxylase